MVNLSEYKRFAKIFGVIATLYILLLEFVIPANSFLPTPTLIIESINPLFEDYNFLNAIGLTFATTLFVPIGGFLCFLLTRYWVIKFALNNNWSQILILAFRVIPYIFVPFLFTQLFGQNIYLQFIYLMIVGGIEQKIFMFDSVSKVNRKFIDNAKTLGLSDKEIHRDMIGKLLIPYTFGKIHYLFLVAWGYSMLYEIISGNYGVGTVLVKALNYNDGAIIFLIFLIIAILIFLSGLSFKFVERKLIYWIPDEIK